MPRHFLHYQYDSIIEVPTDFQVGQPNRSTLQKIQEVFKAGTDLSVLDAFTRDELPDNHCDYFEDCVDANATEIIIETEFNEDLFFTGESDEHAMNREIIIEEEIQKYFNSGRLTIAAHWMDDAVNRSYFILEFTEQKQVV